MATWVIISGSPYRGGKCTSTAHQIAQELQDSHGASVHVFSCDALKVHGCIGCDSCKDDFTCIYQDDHQDLEEALSEADALLVISPIFFAGVPSQLKALLDRFQPYFWKRQQQLAENLPRPEKRPLYVALVGEGGDPYGSDPALASVASPLALADFAVRYHQTFIRVDQPTLANELSTIIMDADKELR